MDKERTHRRFESVYSRKVRAGKRRTYFFDVRRTKGDDFYLTLTESTKRYEGDGYERHKIFLYKEDFNRFLAGLEDVIEHVKTELLPEYDYDEFTRRHEEYESQLDMEDEEDFDNRENQAPSNGHEKPAARQLDEETEVGTEDDISW